MTGRRSVSNKSDHCSLVCRSLIRPSLLAPLASSYSFIPPTISHLRARHPSPVTSVFTAYFTMDLGTYRADCYNPLLDDPGFEMDIITAASKGDCRQVQLLLQEGAQAGAVNASGWTPLMYAAHYGHVAVVRVLIEAGCDVEQREWKDQRTALMMAASNGHTKCMELLIHAGKADIRATDTNGKDAAYYAKTHGHGGNQIIQRLLQMASPKPKPNSSPVPPVVVTDSSPVVTPSPFLSPGSRAHACPSPKKYRAAVLSARKRVELQADADQKSLPSDLDDLLQRLGLTMYRTAFQEQGVDLFTFADLSEEDLQAIGVVKLGHRKRLMSAQVRLAESVEISSAQELVFADYLLHERRRLQQEYDSLMSFVLQWRDAVNVALDFVSRLVAQKQADAAAAATAAAVSASDSGSSPAIDAVAYRSL